jgi:glycosyltransferase involved in cell wall biosynthesis
VRILLAADHCYPAYSTQSSGLHPMTYPSGSGYHIHDLIALGLAEAGHEVFYLLPNGWSKMPPAGVTPVSEPVDGVDICHTVFIPRLQEDLHRLMESAGRPWVTTVHMDYVKLGLVSDANWVFPSRSLARTHGRERFVWNGLHPDDYLFAEAKQDYFLFLSSMDRAVDKGLDTALELSRVKGFRLVVAGSARTAETIAEVGRMCAAYGAEYLGDVRGTSKAELLAGARALLFPTRLNEGCPLVVQEALMSGTPVITSFALGCREILPPEAGFLCATFQDYSTAVDRLPRVSPALCRRAALERFHYRRMVAEYLREYQAELSTEPTWRRDGPRSHAAVSHISGKGGQFPYYDIQLGGPDWKNCKVLDFGGNIGNLLRDPACTVDHRKYWSLDVSRDAIDTARRLYPEAHWLFYDRYNFAFNPGGIRDLPLPFNGERFDLILANSVFTHIALKEMLALVDDLLRLLEPGGRLAFSFIDPNYRSWPAEYSGNNFQYRLDRINDIGNRTLDVADHLERVRNGSWFILADDADLYVESEDLPDYSPNDGKSFHVFHTAGFMRKLYPHAEIREPANREMQHCCILTKR